MAGLLALVLVTISTRIFALTLRSTGAAKSNMRVKADCYHPCVGHTVESNNFSAWTLMLNGYYDFGTYSAVTPYIGAGIGVASIKVHDYASSLAGSLTFNDKTTNNFAWNLMAGAAIAVTDNVKLDANYRFVSLGEVKTGGASNGGGDNPVHYDNLYAHDFRVGLRYDLN